MLSYLKAHAASLSHLPVDVVAYYQRNVMVSKEERRKVAAAGQSDDPLWHKARQGRIGGTMSSSPMGWLYPYNPSKGYDHANKTLRTILKDILWSSFRDNPACKYGKEHEPIAQQCVEEFLRTVVLTAATSVTFHYPGGLIIPDYDFLCASVDGLVRVVHADGTVEMILIEIKCPYGPLYPDIPPAYFAQVQFYMGCLRLLGGEYATLTRCFFVVWSETTVKVVEVAHAQAWFTEVMLPTLMAFYVQHLLPLFILKECGLLEVGHVQLLSKLSLPSMMPSPIAAKPSHTLTQLRGIIPLAKPRFITAPNFGPAAPAPPRLPLVPSRKRPCTAVEASLG